jgi:hypothetical protein
VIDDGTVLVVVEAEDQRSNDAADAVDLPRSVVVDVADAEKAEAAAANGEGDAKREELVRCRR